MAITYALMQRLEELSEKEPQRVQIIKKARVTALNKEGNKITGVTYEFNGQSSVAEGPVILATGGYAADFTETSLLKKYKPEVYDLASTNGQHATGDGQKMVMAIGGNGIDMDKVQVHPTGLVDPKDPDSKWKFLAAEGRKPWDTLFRLAANSRQLFVAKAGFYSMRRVTDSAMSSGTVITSLARCSRTNSPSGLF